VVLFDDTGELLPGGRQVPPRRPGAPCSPGAGISTAWDRLAQERFSPLPP